MHRCTAQLACMHAANPTAASAWLEDDVGRAFPMTAHTRRHAFSCGLTPPEGTPRLCGLPAMMTPPFTTLQPAPLSQPPPMMTLPFTTGGSATLTSAARRAVNGVGPKATPCKNTSRRPCGRCLKQVALRKHCPEKQ